MSDIQHVAVLGLGTMGSGIAQVCAMSGHDVTVLEVDQGTIDRGIGRHRRPSSTAAFHAARSPRHRKRSNARPHPDTSEVGDLAGASWSSRQSPRMRTSSVTFWPQIADIVADDAIIATNTSAMSVTFLANCVRNPSAVRRDCTSSIRRR